MAGAGRRCERHQRPAAKRSQKNRHRKKKIKPTRKVCLCVCSRKQKPFDHLPEIKINKAKLDLSLYVVRIRPIMVDDDDASRALIIKSVRLPTQFTLGLKQHSRRNNNEKRQKI